MTDDLIALEERLIAAYQAQAPLYDRAIRLAAGDAADLTDMNAVLHEVTTLDAGVAEDKADWRSSGAQLGPRLRAALENVTRRIETLRALVDRRVAEVEARKQALTPKVDECIQQRRMLQAYAKTR